MAVGGDTLIYPALILTLSCLISRDGDVDSLPSNAEVCEWVQLYLFSMLVSSWHARETEPLLETCFGQLKISM